MKNTNGMASFVSLFLILTADSLFFLKYASRFLSLSIVIIIFLVIAAVKLWLFIFLKRQEGLKINALVIFLPLLTIAAAGLLFIPPAGINVDRWDTVYYWWDAFIKGVYPYSARTRFNGLANQLPFLQYFYFPAYFYIDYIGLMVLLFVFVNISVRRGTGRSPFDYDNNRLAILALSITSFGVLWDIVCRSSLFVNSSMILLVIYYLLYNENNSIKKFIIGGILAGLVAATRLVVLIPLISAGLFLLIRDKFRNFAGYLITFIIGIFVFTLTFVPLLAFPPSEIRAFNPFIIQESHMPRILTAVFIALAVAAGFLRSRRNLILSNGVLLWLAGFTYISRQVISRGLDAAFFGSKGDISYLTLSLPFLLFCLAGLEERNVSDT